MDTYKSKEYQVIGTSIPRHDPHICMIYDDEGQFNRCIIGFYLLGLIYLLLDILFSGL